MTWAPTSTTLAVSAAWLGLSAALPPEHVAERLGYALAGFLGGLISLGFAYQPNVWQRFVAIVAGLAAGLFVAPPLAEMLGGTLDEGLAGALLIGLLAMPIFGGAHRLAEMWNTNPAGMLGFLVRLWRGRPERGRDE